MDLDWTTRVVESDMRTKRLEKRVQELEKMIRQLMKDHQANQPPPAKQPAAEAPVKIKIEEHVEEEEDPDDFPDPSPLRPRTRVTWRSGNTVIPPLVKRSKYQRRDIIHSAEKTRGGKRQRCEERDNPQLARLPTKRSRGLDVPHPYSPITRCEGAKQAPVGTSLYAAEQSFDGRIAGYMVMPWSSQGREGGAEVFDEQAIRRDAWCWHREAGLGW